MADYHKIINSLEPKEEKMEDQSELNDRLAANETNVHNINQALLPFQARFSHKLRDNIMEKLGHDELKFGDIADE